MLTQQEESLLTDIILQSPPPPTGTVSSQSLLPKPKIHQYNIINNERFCTAAANVMRYILTGGAGAGYLQRKGERGRYATIFLGKYHDVVSTVHCNVMLDGQRDHPSININLSSING